MVEEGIMVKFPSVPLAMCLLYLQLLFQGSFHQEEVKQPHCRDTQRGEEEDCSGQLQEEGRHTLPSQMEIYCVGF